MTREDYLAHYGVAPSDAYPEQLRQMIRDHLAEGIKTQTDPFPETDREFAEIQDQLRGLEADQLYDKLVLSGWLVHPHGAEKMCCESCMYYLVHNRWCDLPELDLPAEPEWYCRLWRV